MSVLLACSLSLAGAPAWALGTHLAGDRPPAAAPRALFPSQWSSLHTVPAEPDAGCEEQIRNGGFASSQDWTIGPSPRPARLAYPPRRSAAPIMHLGIHATDAHRAVHSYSSIWQEVTLPADRASTLRWSWQLHTEEDPVADPDPDGDRQQVLVLDAEGRLLEVIVNTRVRQRTWATRTHDLSAYAGQTVRLYFNTYNDGDVLISSMWLDDVSLQVCGSENPGTGMTPRGTDKPVRGAWSGATHSPEATTGFLTWGAGVAFSLFLIALGLWQRAHSPGT